MAVDETRGRTDSSTSHQVPGTCYIVRNRLRKIHRAEEDRSLIYLVKIHLFFLVPASQALSTSNDIMFSSLLIPLSKLPILEPAFSHSV